MAEAAVAAAAPATPIPAAAPVAAAEAPKGDPKSRAIEALKQIKADVAAKDAATAGEAAKPVAPAPGEVKPPEAAKPAEDPSEKLHAAVSKLNAREAGLRQREAALKAQIDAGKAAADKATKYDRLVQQLIDDPRGAVISVHGEDKASDFFNKAVSQFASSPEQIEIEKVRAEMRALRGELTKKEEDALKTKESQTHEQTKQQIANNEKVYFDGLKRTATEQATEYHLVNRKGDVAIQLAFQVADIEAAKNRRLMPFAEALSLVERHYRDEARADASALAALEAPAAPAADKPKAGVTVKRSDTPTRHIQVKKTLSNAMQGNVISRATKPNKSMSREERLALAMQQIGR